MSENRLRSIVPMFGGATKYVDTLDSIVEFVASYEPATDELVGWHRGTFTNVSSRESIMRRVSYLQQVGFLQREDDQWNLGPAGTEYTQNHDIATLLQIMCERNVGLRSLLYALSVGPLTIEEISEQQLDTHPELGWGRGETDMALQRANWLCSMGVVKKTGTNYELTTDGKAFVEDAVEVWADSTWTPTSTPHPMTAETYETVAHARALDPEFRATVLSRYGLTCPVSGVDHPGLLDVAHILSWSEYPAYRADLSNVLPLSKLHHAAFDRELFTIDCEYRLQVNPSFETKSDVLKRTIIDRVGERLPLASDLVDQSYLRQYNSTLTWL